jgi:hypothetical protein
MDMTVVVARGTSDRATPSYRYIQSELSPQSLRSVCIEHATGSSGQAGKLTLAVM